MSVEIEESVDAYGDRRYTVVRDGQPVAYRSTYAVAERDTAQRWAAVIAQLPAGYVPSYHSPRAGAIGARAGWRIWSADGVRSARLVTDMDDLPAVAADLAAGESARAVVSAALDIVTTEAERLGR
ncbi:hypothetical protein [Pseudonocardia sp. HH130630-07]|uniref:hypothetical protein n=1 Tax=Pseudonocardia sp. HH130630-07 TaxID=1690815 RepID=UPI000814C214|nr:hypothetical protein [Pseudonocardia sp. HH130630-07]ANY10524.1 hypothetical protein AFB00_29355 [Pseudonocardia sp. HH130630-07]